VWIPFTPKSTALFYKLRYAQGGKSTSQFIRPQFVGEVRRQLAAYKKFNTLTRKWVALAVELSKMELEEARSATPTMRWPQAS